MDVNLTLAPSAFVSNVSKPPVALRFKSKILIGICSVLLSFLQSVALMLHTFDVSLASKHVLYWAHMLFVPKTWGAASSYFGSSLVTTSDSSCGGAIPLLTSFVKQLGLTHAIGSIQSTVNHATFPWMDCLWNLVLCSVSCL